MRFEIGHLTVKIPYLRIVRSKSAREPAALFAKATNVVAGSVVVSRCGWDVGVVKAVENGKPTEIYAMPYVVRGTAYTREYGGVDTVQWYNTGIWITFEEWKRIAVRLGDADNFYKYWRRRIGLAV